jgi:tyrosyl-tRNA synthetase
MFGKLMSISDDLMEKYYLLVLGEVMDKSMHPMEAKKQLAAKCVAAYHGTDAAKEARDDFETRFSKKDLAHAELPVVKLGERRDVLGVALQAYADAFQTNPSGGDVRRLIQGGSVQLNGEKLADPKATPEWKDGDVLKLDKKRQVRISV